MLSPRRGTSRSTSNRKTTRSPRRSSHSTTRDSLLLTKQAAAKEGDTTSESTAASKEAAEMRERDMVWKSQSAPDDRSVEVIVPESRGMAPVDPMHPLAHNSYGDEEEVPLNVMIIRSKQPADTKIMPLKKEPPSEPSSSHRYRQPRRMDSSSSRSSTSSRKSSFSMRSGSSEIHRRHSNEDSPHGSHFDVDVGVQPRRRSHDGGMTNEFRSHSESHRGRRSGFLPASGNGSEFRSSSSDSHRSRSSAPVYVDSSQIEWNSHFPTTAAAASDLKSAMKQQSGASTRHSRSQSDHNASVAEHQQHLRSALKRTSSIRRHSNDSAVSNGSSHHYEVDPPPRRRSNDGESVVSQRSPVPKRSILKQSASPDVVAAAAATLIDTTGLSRRGGGGGSTPRSSNNGSSSSKKRGDGLDTSSGHASKSSKEQSNKPRPSFRPANRDQKLGDFIAKQQSRISFGGDDDDDSTFIPSSDAGSLLGDISVRQKSVRHLQDPHESVDDDGFGSIAGSRKGTYEGFS